MKKPSFKDLILFEDNNLIAINKPARVSSLEDRGISPFTIHSLATEYCAEATLCHRLDKETSGLLLISKNDETYRQIAIGFQNRLIFKTYWAVADGRHYFKDHVVEIPLGQSARGKAKVDHRNGKPAKTIFNVVETFRHFSLIEYKPITGRLHQIRIHSAVQNAPITGDTIYGGSVPMLAKIKKDFNYNHDREPRPMIERTALHAKSVTFNYDGKPITLEAPLPKDFNVLLTLLRKYDLS